MFIQIGDFAFNPAHIVAVEFSPEIILLVFDVTKNGVPATDELHGAEARAFLNWWEHRAEVDVLYIEDNEDEG